MKASMVLALALFAPQGAELGKEVTLKVKAIDGKEYDVAALAKEGKVIAIVSWSVDCPSGKVAIPRATAIAKKFEGNDKVVFIGVCSYGDGEKTLADYVKEKKIAYPICHDGDKKIGKALGAKRVNSAYVIGGGKLFWHGGMKLKGGDGMDTAIEAALAGKEAPPSGSKFDG
jgi:hypothetical protein